MYVLYKCMCVYIYCWGSSHCTWVNEMPIRIKEHEIAFAQIN